MRNEEKNTIDLMRLALKFGCFSMILIPFFVLAVIIIFIVKYIL